MFDMVEELLADMGKYVVSGDPDVLVALGLGSCIGVAVYDVSKKIGGMAHVMLPDSNECRNTRSGFNMNKFADIAIPNMLSELEKRGCSKINMWVKIAGGAHMFKAIVTDDSLDIGKRNSEAVMAQIETCGLKISSKDIGGSIGRTLRFELNTGRLLVKTKDKIVEI